MRNPRGVKNDNGHYYQVDDQLPEELPALQKQTREIFRDNKKLSTSQQLEMTFKQGKLLIDNKLYQKHFHPHKPAEILNQPELEREIAKEMTIIEGQEHCEGNSKFMGYAHSVGAIEDI